LCPNRIQGQDLDQFFLMLMLLLLTLACLLIVLERRLLTSVSFVFNIRKDGTDRQQNVAILLCCGHDEDNVILMPSRYRGH